MVLEGSIAYYEIVTDIGRPWSTRAGHGLRFDQ
jgi:hypothetical protein